MVDTWISMFIIDFLNPRCGSRGGGFYGTSPDQEVEGHHILMEDPVSPSFPATRII